MSEDDDLSVVYTEGGCISRSAAAVRLFYLLCLFCRRGRQLIFKIGASFPDFKNHWTVRSFQPMDIRL